ncbi:SDR family oxidoreductase [soil metagenome]
MKVLVTGGAGFIGSNLVRLLRGEGHAVSVLDDLSTGYESNLEPFRDVRFVRGDVRDQSAVADAAAGAEVIFHLAASVGNARAIDNPIADSETNVIGTLRVLEAARRLGVRKVVYSSSAGVFGELRHLPIREDHPIEPDTPYGASKLAGEKHSLAYSRLHGLEAVCLRYFNVYGVNQRYDAYGNVIPIFVQRLLAGEMLTVFGDGEQTRDFINVEDVIQANYLAGVNRGLSGVFNLGSGEAVTINRLIALLTAASGITPSVEHGPPRKGDVRDSLADITAARERLGFVPAVRLEDGLHAYIEWMREQMQRGSASVATAMPAPV